jgi:hypothetical protein
MNPDRIVDIARIECSQPKDDFVIPGIFERERNDERFPVKKGIFDQRITTSEKPVRTAYNRERLNLFLNEYFTFHSLCGKDRNIVSVVEIPSDYMNPGAR